MTLIKALKKAAENTSDKGIGSIQSDDLGGKSINAVSIIAKMESRYCIQIHSYNLAENPTIAELSAYLDKHPLPVRGAKAKRAKFFRG